MNKRQTNTKVDTIMTTITIQYDCFQVQMLSKKRNKPLNVQHRIQVDVYTPT